MVLASAYGQYVAGLIGASMAEAREGDSLADKLITYTDSYKQLGVYSLIAGIVLIALSPIVKKLMSGVKYSSTDNFLIKKSSILNIELFFISDRRSI